MRARLYSPATSLTVSHEFRQEVTLGRAASNTLCLDSRLLSGLHARIRWDEQLGCYRLEDLGSTNGTRLDGRRVEDALLGHLHVVTLADKLDIVFQDLDRCNARHRAQQGTPAAATGFAGPRPTVPEVERTQHTSIQSLAIALPELLRAAGAQPASPKDRESSQVTEGTMMERLPLPLPSFLRQAAPSPAAAPLEAAPSAADPPATDPPQTTPPAARDASTESGPISSAGFTTAEVPPTRDVRKGDYASGAPFEPESLPAGTADIFFLAAHSQAGTQHYPIQEGANVIGRAAGTEIRIDSPEVSRQHAQITLLDGRMMLRDLGSRNRTFVNGEPLAKEAVNVMPGQRLRFGALEVVLGVTAAKPQGDGP